ncbi:MAG: metal-dependent hydrolase [Clostridia bacterium]|nr:metal-dependent hydrolase [Clostridia bacterium]
MSQLIEEINGNDAQAFTHSGKFHADDVFSSALLLYLNPEIRIQRGNRVPEDFAGIVYDIGRGKYDHHQMDSRIRENGVPYAAFGLLWEELGAQILGEELALRFDHDFVQPLDINDNTGEKNELASLIGDFNPPWDEEGSNDAAFFEAVNLAGTILENKFAKYRGNERADQQVEEFLAAQDGVVRDGLACDGTSQIGFQEEKDNKILVMPYFVPCQKKLSETEIEFIVFPSNRGGYCVQPLKKRGSMNYKCSFPSEWLGLENEELQKVSGIGTASFCHKGGFLLSVGELEDAVEACRKSQKVYVSAPVIVYYREKSYTPSEEKEQVLSTLKRQLKKISGMRHTQIKVIESPELPSLVEEEYYKAVDMEKGEWKELQKKVLKKILREKPEAVVVDGCGLMTYPIIRMLRKKHVTVMMIVDNVMENEECCAQLVRMP